MIEQRRVLALEYVLKQRTQTYDRLRIARYNRQFKKIFHEQFSKYEIEQYWIVVHITYRSN